MAKELEEGEFWLPSEFLCDDFFLEEKKSREAERGLSGPCFLGEFSHGFCPEGNEEDHVAGLARKLANSFLVDDKKNSFSAVSGDSAKFMVGSPQSTLCGLPKSSKGSPNGPSKVSSPTSIENHQENAWDLLYEAAGEVMKQRLENQGFQQNMHGRRLMGSSRRNSAHISAPPRSPHGTGYYSPPPVLSQQQLKAAQLYQLKQQQLCAAWGRQSRARGGGEGYGIGSSPSARTLSKQQQQQFPSGSGMRPVFRSGSGAKREKPTGTGVFLPRRVGAQPESCKKPACSTVLLPARVVQALNLNLDELSPHPRIRGSFLLDQDALLSRNSAVVSHQKRKKDQFHQSAAVSSHEIRLPQEWTY